jgi:hypothetical protein
MMGGPSSAEKSMLGHSCESVEQSAKIQKNMDKLTVLSNASNFSSLSSMLLMYLKVFEYGSHLGSMVSLTLSMAREAWTSP